MNQIKKWLKTAITASKEEDWQVVNSLKLKAAVRICRMAAKQHPDTFIAAKIALRIMGIKTQW